MGLQNLAECVATASSHPVSPDWSSLTLRSLGFLLLLGLVAYGVSRIAKRSFNNSINTSKKEGKVFVSDSRPLGNRQFLVVAEYGDQKHLLGVSPGKIEHLAKLEGSSDNEQSERSIQSA